MKASMSRDSISATEHVTNTKRSSPGSARRHSTPDGRSPCCSTSRVRRSEWAPSPTARRSAEHTSELQSRFDIVCRLLLEQKDNTIVDRDSKPDDCQIC